MVDRCTRGSWPLHRKVFQYLHCWHCSPVFDHITLNTFVFHQFSGNGGDNAVPPIEGWEVLREDYGHLPIIEYVCA